MPACVDTETAALIALLRTKKAPAGDYARRIDAAGSALAVLQQGEEPARPRLFNDECPDLRQLLADAASHLERWRAQGISVVSVLDPAYPRNLRPLNGRPAALFVQGRLKPEDDRSIAVIGSRNASRRGLELTQQIAEHLVQNGYVVVSGLAAGIDTAAHTAALGASGRTLAVIGSGLNHCYPPQNAPLQRQIQRAAAVISQFLPDAPPTRQTFPMRNATMAGLTLATVVTEASETSGTRVAVRYALTIGRTVFLTEQVRMQPWAANLISNPRVRVIRTPTDITNAMPP